MPLRRLVHEHTRSPGADKLSADLLNEWRSPSETAGQPVIIEDGGGAKPVHLYVIWAAWQDMDQVERSEIIMDVYEQVHGQAKALEVTVAMGLTPKEAQRMGISYQ